MTAVQNKATKAGDTLFIPLNRLKKSPRNARKTPHPKADIEALAASIAAKGLLQNLVVEPERNRVEVLTVDALVEGVHFDRAFVPPDAIGHRALAVNLSDLAASRLPRAVTGCDVRNLVRHNTG